MVDERRLSTSYEEQAVIVASSPSPAAAVRSKRISKLVVSTSAALPHLMVAQSKSSTILTTNVS